MSDTDSPLQTPYLPPAPTGNLGVAYVVRSHLGTYGKRKTEIGCPRCSQRGLLWNDGAGKWEPCSACGGTGWHDDPRNLNDD